MLTAMDAPDRTEAKGPTMIAVVVLLVALAVLVPKWGVDSREHDYRSLAHPPEWQA